MYRKTQNDTPATVWHWLKQVIEDQAGNLLIKIMTPSEFKKLFNVHSLKKIGTDSSTLIAYHEAGHAIIDIHYGLIPVFVTIIPNPDEKNLGHNRIIYADQEYDMSDYLFENNIEWSDEKILEYEVISLLGGIISEAFYTGCYNWEGAGSDLNTILDHFLSYMITDIPDMQPYWDKTFSIVESKLSDIKIIVSDLLKYKTLERQYFIDNFSMNQSI